MSIDSIIGLVEFILALIALIIIHEFGHFVASRLLHVDVEEFGIGFPPRLATLFTAWGTKFTLNAIPLGGFVRPKGENDPNVPGGLAAAKPGVRLAVYVAGPLMNLLVGVILYAIIFTRVGMPDQTRVQVVEVSPKSPASTAGLAPGDMILQLNNQAIHDTTTAHDIIYANLDKPVTMVYERNGKQFTTTLTPRSNPPSGQGAIGISMGPPTTPINIAQALPNGVSAVYQHSVALLSLPVQILRGQESASAGRLVGFKGMFDIYQEVRQTPTAQTGIPTSVNVLLFFTNITISLGLLNLFPFPALDGGRILFVLPELIIRRRIPAEYENVINLVGFGLLLLLLIYINLQDFIAPPVLPK